jgi:hypothetical protein
LPTNLLHAYGEVPKNWEPFLRVEQPTPGIYQILDGDKPTYQKVDGVWTDVWPLRDMTPEEKLAKQQKVKDLFNNMPQASNFSAWTFDEKTCEMVAPVHYPTDGKNYFWCGAENRWKEAPVHPNDNKVYNFDFFNWQWVAD